MATTDERKLGYPARCAAQLKAWVAGDSRHNDVDDVCCPDFSCCIGVQATPEERRRFADASDEEQDALLITFLRRTVARNFPRGNIRVVGGEL